MCFEMIRINDLYRYLGKGSYIIVDLRDKEEYDSGHIPGAVNLPYETTQNLAYYISGYKYVFLYCSVGSHSLLAIRDLRYIPCHLYQLCGGIRAWKGKLEKS